MHVVALVAGCATAFLIFPRMSSRIRDPRLGLGMGMRPTQLMRRPDIHRRANVSGMNVAWGKKSSTVLNPSKLRMLTQLSTERPSCSGVEINICSLILGTPDCQTVSFI